MRKKAFSVKENYRELLKKSGIRIIFSGLQKSEKSDGETMGRIGFDNSLYLQQQSEEILSAAAAAAPVYYEEIPLTLEEIFIYELGGEHYAVREMVL